MDTVINYSDYYRKDFIDPLYATYYQKRTIELNPYLVNKNEVRDGCKGLYFKKYSSESPCPPGYSRYGIDYCKGEIGPVIGLYNCPFKGEYFPENNAFDLLNYNRVSINFYK